MQNVPITEQQRTATNKWRSDAAKNVSTDTTDALFDELLNKQTEVVSQQLETTGVTSDAKMADTASETVSDRRTAHKEKDKDEEGKDSTVGKPSESTVQSDDTPSEAAADTKMTAEDVRDLEDDLKEYGFSDDEIKKLEKRAESDEGLTWGQFVNSLTEKMQGLKGASLSGEQSKDLKSFLSKIGFDEKGTAKVLALLQQGDREKALDAINKQLASLADSKQLNFSKGEMNAFVAAMGLSKEASAKIREILGKSHLPKDMKEALSEIRQELKSLENKNRNLVKAVGKAAATAMDDESAKNSAARHLSGPVDQQAKTAAGEQPSRQGAEGGNADLFGDRNSTTSHDAGVKAGPAAQAKPGESADAAMESFMDDGNSKSEEKSNWKSFFSTLREDASKTGGRLASSKTDGALADAAGKAASKPVTAKTAESTNAPRMARQVESAILKNVGQGTKQLTLKLNPENLGKLHIVLQTKGDEVRALIRADSHDTARVLSEQIDSIRSSLENQGLKVAKIDVQTSLTGNQDNANWFGQDSHNMAREREEFARFQSRLRNLRSEEDALAQDVNLPHDKANLAQQGLHIVA